MRVYRIGKTEYVYDLEGTGAKLFGGRWNHVGFPCIYTSESRALAVLEYLVNVSIEYIPKNLSICVFEIDENQIDTTSCLQLPRTWRDIPASLAAKDFGTLLLKKGTPVFKIPSVVIPEEYNYVINPLAKGIVFKQLTITDFVYGVRLQKN